MNPDIQNFLNNYQTQIDGYKSRLPEGHAASLASQAFLDKMIAVGERFEDIGSFMGQVASDGSMNEMSAIMTAQAMAALDGERESGNMKIASAAEFAEPYHKSYDAIVDIDNMPLTRSVYEQVFVLEKNSADAAYFLMALAKQNLFVKMASAAIEEQSKKNIKGTEDLSLPAVSSHLQKMTEMAQSATSVLEIEYGSQRLMELSEFEKASDMMLTQDLCLGIYSATQEYIISPDEEHRAEVEANARFLAEFYGLLWTDIYQLPRFKDFIDKVILGEVKKQHPEQTIESNTIEHMAAIKKCLEGKAPVEPGSSSRQNFQLWGNTYPLEKALELYRNPIRPDAFLT